MSEIKTKEKLVGQLSAVTLNATANVPDWLQPLVKENGVYVGVDEPTDPTKLVWINPDGQASDLSNYYTKDETDSLIDTAIQDIDLSSYATKVELENYDTSEQVDAKISAIKIPEIDLSEYAKKSEIPSVEGLATENYVDKAISTIPLPDLTDYAKKTDIPDVSGFLTSIPDEYITETELEAKGYLTEHQDLSAYALKTEIPTIPTKVSDLTNDAGFITSADIPEVDLSSYALKTEIPDVSAFQTEEQVNALINTALGVIENGTY